MNQKVDLKMTPWINKPDHRQVSEERSLLFFVERLMKGEGVAFNLNRLTQIISRAETKS